MNMHINNSLVDVSYASEDDYYRTTSVWMTKLEEDKGDRDDDGAYLVMQIECSCMTDCNKQIEGKR